MLLAKEYRYTVGGVYRKQSSYLLTKRKTKPMLRLIRSILHNLRIIMVVSNEMARSVAPITVPAAAGTRYTSVASISGTSTKMSAGKDPIYKERYTSPIDISCADSLLWL